MFNCCRWPGASGECPESLSCRALSSKTAYPRDFPGVRSCPGMSQASSGIGWPMSKGATQSSSRSRGSPASCTCSPSPCAIRLSSFSSHCSSDGQEPRGVSESIFESISWELKVFLCAASEPFLVCFLDAVAEASASARAAKSARLLYSVMSWVASPGSW